MSIASLIRIRKDNGLFFRAILYWLLTGQEQRQRAKADHKAQLNLYIVKISSVGLGQPVKRWNPSANLYKINIRIQMIHAGLSIQRKNVDY